MLFNTTASIVLYKNDDTVKKAINSLLQSELVTKLYLVDNSPTDILKKHLADLLADRRVEYIFNNKNLGYGKAHNIALQKVMDQSKYHLVLNPDIEFEPGVLEDIFRFMEVNNDVGLLLPKVFYKNGDIQKLCNYLPTPLNLISRRFFINANWAKKINDEYELKGFNYDRCINVPNLSGCFMFLRNSILQQTGFFDNRYFMYMEDVDLCRRIHAVAKTIFYPGVHILHGFEKESYNNPSLLKHHIISAIKYFNKWGWIIDRKRKYFNKKFSEEISSKQ